MLLMLGLRATFATVIYNIIDLLIMVREETQQFTNNIFSICIWPRTFLLVFAWIRN